MIGGFRREGANQVHQGAKAKGRRQACRAAGCFLAVLGLLGAVASASSGLEVHPELGVLGSISQPSFAEVKGLTVSDGQIYVIDGRSESQEITVSGSAGNFKLKFNGGERELSFNASKEEVRDSLREIACGGNICLIVTQGNASGSYLVTFARALASTELPQIECESGSPPLSGGSGCSVETTVQGVNGSVSRFNADGTPANFSALGSNVIDGRGGADETPQAVLIFEGINHSQVAVDTSGTATNGDIYITQESSNLVDVFDSTGAYLGQITDFREGPLGEGAAKGLSGVCGVATDPGGALYVGDLGTGVHKYTQPGSPHNPLANSDNSANFTSTKFPCTLAAGSGSTAGFLFVNNFSPFGLFKVDATNGTLKFTVDTGGGVAVDPTSGRVFAAKGKEVREFDASGASEAKLRSAITVPTNVTGVAVDGASGNVYVAREGSPTIEVFGPLVKLPDVITKPATEISGSAARLNGTISADEGPNASCHFEYVSQSAFEANGFEGAATAPCSPAGPFTGSTVQEVSGEAAPLEAATKYEFRIVGENANGSIPGTAKSFETLGPPIVKGAPASEVTASTARISGEISPRGLASEFTVEYVSEAQFEASEYAEATTTPAKAIGNGIEFVKVAQQLSGLAPGTTYHFRLVASNEAGITQDEDRTFDTFPAPAPTLPDNRSYELVSPPVKLGEVFPPEPKGRGLQGSCLFCMPGFQSVKMPMQASPDGEAIVYEGGPFTGGLASGANEYLARREAGGWGSSALSEPLFVDQERQGFRAFSEDLSRGVLAQTLPVLSPQAPPEYPNLYFWEEGVPLVPLIGTAPPNRDPGVGANGFVPTFAGANAGTATVPAFSRAIFQANDALTEEVAGIAPQAPAVGEEETNLYEWSEGELRLVNVAPGNASAIADAVIGSEGLLAGFNFDFEHAISDDGSRIFWSARASGQVFVREGATTTIEVPDPGLFLTAATDGSKVLLNDGAVYDLESESLTDLTGGLGGFQGFLGAADDLSRIYFVDTKVLTGSEENANEETAEEGKPNLYLGEGGATRFIAMLAANDDNLNTGGDVGAWHAAPGDRLAQVTGDGRYLAFMSRAPLTGYDSRAASGEGCTANGAGSPVCPEVFEYDAQGETLSCASCRPSGERPLGKSNLSLLFGIEEAVEQPANLPDEAEGRLFFESQDTLTQQDTNGAFRDVYEWQPEGVGGCTRPRGCVALITSGRDPVDSQFVNSTPSGQDIFFTTRERLVRQDIDEFMDLYDARVGGGFSEGGNAPCEGEGCAGPISPPPVFEVPGSSGVSGEEAPPAKPKRCRAGFVKRGNKCVRKKAAKHRRHKHRRGGRR